MLDVRTPKHTHGVPGLFQVVELHDSLARKDIL